MTERSLFMSLLEIQDPAAREKFLQEACPGDAALRAGVAALLKSHEAAGQFLVAPVINQISPLDYPSSDVTLNQRTTEEAPGGAIGGATGPRSNGTETMHEDLDVNSFRSYLQPGSHADSLGRLDHYEVLEVLGRGGFGIVLKAFDEMLHRMVAIKLMSPELAATSPARKRFLREARSSAAARHENIVAIYAVGEQPIPYLVMEYVPGETLLKRLDERGPLELGEVLRLGHQIASGLAAAHAMGLIHRDVKPANILLEAGVGERVKITDFGLARAADDASLTQSGLIAGTPMYMAPEQARGEMIDQRADLFSLGSVLYLMTSGRPPFRAPNTVAVLKRVCEDTPRPIREIIPEVPERLCNLISKLHAKHPEDRFQTAQEVADLLARYQDEEPDSEPTPQTAEPFARESIGPTGKNRDATRASSPGPGLSEDRVASASPKLRRTLAAVILLILGLLAVWNHRKNGPRPAAQPTIVSIQNLGNRNFTEKLTVAPTPLDELRREIIPPVLQALAGGGIPDNAPPNLVAILGDGRIQSPNAIPSPDGKWLACPIDRNIVVLDAKTGRLHRTLVSPRSFEIIAFSPDGSQLAGTSWIGWGPGGTDDPYAVVWDVESTEIRCRLVGHTGVPANDSGLASLGISCLAFSPDGRRIATGGVDKMVRTWDARTGLELVACPQGTVPRHVTFSPDSRKLLTGASGAEGGFLKVWNEAGDVVQTFPEHSGEFPNAAFTPDGKWLATGSNTELILRRSDTFAEVRRFDTPGSWLAFSADSRTLVAQKRHYPANEKHHLTRWDLEGQQALAPIALNVTGEWPYYRLSSDGKLIFMRNEGEPLPSGRAYEAATGNEVPGFGHRGGVGCIAIDPAGRLLASGGLDRSVKLWNLATGSVERSLAAHTEGVTSVAFSPDGKTLATAGHEGVVKLWNVADGNERQTLRGHKGYVAMIAFSADGTLLASAGADGTIKLWYLTVDKAERTFTGFTSVVHGIDFSPDGKVIAGASLDGTVRRWNAADGSELAVLRGDSAALRSIAFHPRGTTLVTGGIDSRICEWDLAGRNLKQEVSSHSTVGGTAPVTHLVWNKVGQLLASCGSVDFTVRFWDWETTPPRCFVQSLPTTLGAPTGIALTPDGRYLAIASTSGLIEIVSVAVPPQSDSRSPALRALPDAADLAKRPSAADALDRRKLAREQLAKAGREDAGNVPAELVAVLEDNRLMLPSSGPRSWIDESPDGNLLAVPCGEDVVLFELPTGRRQRILKGPGGQLRQVAFSPDGQLLAASAWDTEPASQVRVWDLAADWAVLDRLPPPTRGVYCLAFSADSRRLVVGGTSGQRVSVADARSGQELKSLDYGPEFHSIMSRSGERIAVADWNSRNVVVLNSETWESVRTLERNFHFAGDVLFDRDGKILIVGSDSEVRIWNAETWNPLHTLPTPGHRVALSADGRTLWTWSVYRPARSRTFCRWDVASGRELGRFAVTSHDDFIQAEISRDGKDLYVVSSFPYLRVFDAETGSERPRHQHAGQVNSVAFSPDGTVLASGGADRTVRVWDVARGQMRHVLTGHQGPVVSVAFDPDGTRLASASTDGSIRLWDIMTGTAVRRLEVHARAATGVAFSPDGATIASAGLDGFVRLCDAKSGRLLHDWRSAADTLHCVAFSPDGKTVAAGSTRGLIQKWDVATGWELGTLKHDGDADVYSLAFHPNGLLLASGSQPGEGSIRLWDLTTSREVRKFEGHSSSIQTVAWRADGGLLVSTGAADGTVRLWSMIGADPGRKVIQAASAGLVCAALSPEGRYIATGNPDGTICILRLAPPGEVFTAAAGR